LNTSAGDFNAGTLNAGTAGAKQHKVADVISTTSVVQGAKYFVNNDGTDADNGADMDDFGGDTSANSSDVGDSATGTAFTGTKRGVVASGTASTFYKQTGQLLFAASEGLLEGTPNTDMLTAQIEGVQAKINTARVQAGSQYAAIESAVNYTTDLTAQYELGFNTVNDVNFSMETAHLAKNQILQQAATAMLAQANQGQQGLLQLIQV
jgi:flagellin